MTALRTRGLTKTYGDLSAVDGLDLTVERGELYGFLGPNGAGKTTTIRMALGLILPTGGEVEVLGASVSTEARRPLERVGALVEEPAFWRLPVGPAQPGGVRSRGRARGTDIRARLGRIDDVLAARSGSRTRPASA